MWRADLRQEPRRHRDPGRHGWAVWDAWQVWLCRPAARDRKGRRDPQLRRLTVVDRCRLVPSAVWSRCLVLAERSSLAGRISRCCRRGFPDGATTGSFLSRASAALWLTLGRIPACDPRRARSCSRRMRDRWDWFSAGCWPRRTRALRRRGWRIRCSPSLAGIQFAGLTSASAF